VEFVGCEAGFGGALACLDGARPNIEGCLFTGNRADFGSGAACRASLGRFIDCRFANNLVAEIGGGLLCEAASNPTLERCSFEGNLAEIGGGLACRDGSDPQLLQCRFVRNVADAGGAEAGAAWCANSSPAFRQCVFDSNEARGHGGAIVCVMASPRFSNCTFYGNRSPVGGGMFSWLDSGPAIESTIIAFSPDGEAVACESGGAAVLQCCDLYGNAGGDWVGFIANQLADSSNFTSDPLFSDPLAGDFSLQPTSPCLPAHHPNNRICGVLGASGHVASPPGTADLALRKVANRLSVHIGEEVTFKITLTNLGPAVARGIEFGDPVPDALNFVSFACDRGTVLGSFCSVDSLAPGDSVTALLVATPIPNPAPSERWCENTAYIAASTTSDVNPGNNTATSRVRISELPSSSGEGAVPSPRATLASKPSPQPGHVRFVFSLPTPQSRVELCIYDVRGRRLAILAGGAFAAGDHCVDWRWDAAPGVYLARLQTTTDTISLKVR
jgi:uncharacterized repeat protein (TIGR01451 family)